MPTAQMGAITIKMRVIKLITLSLVGWYLFLILVHYFNQRPLWNDEVCILANILEKTPGDMFQTPLSHLQQFPRVYLLAIQQFSKHFDFHLLALRFIPFICMFAAFLIWFYIGFLELGEGIALLTFVGCWVASAPLIYYAAELKQYSMDVLAAGVFVLVLRDHRKLESCFWILPLFGLFSYPAFFFMGFPAFYFLRKYNFRKFFGYIFLCLVVLGIVYNFDIKVNAVNSIGTYWNDHFISLSSWKLFFKTLGENFNNLISRWFVENPKWIRGMARFFIPIGLLYLIFSAWKTFKKDKFMFYSVNAIALAVLIEHILAGVLQKYPFAVPRTSLFFAPMLLLMTAKGIYWIKDKQKSVYYILQYVFLIYLGYISLGLARIIFAGDLGAQPSLI